MARRLGGIALVGALAAIAFPGTARAEVFCDYVDAGVAGPQDNILAITVLGDEEIFEALDRNAQTLGARPAVQAVRGHEDDEDDESLFDLAARIAIRSDGRITVTAPGGPPAACAGGEPTLTNIDLIRVVADYYGFAVLDLGGGPLGPGATDEGDGSSEIEIAAVGSYAPLYVLGTAGPDRFAVSRSGRTGELSINLNPIVDGSSPDPDVTAGEDVFVGLLGGGGADRFSAELRGRPDDDFEELGLGMLGGAGSDALLAELDDAILAGGRGDDVVRTRGEDGELEGGTGRDTLYAGPGGVGLAGGDGADVIFGGDGRDSLDGDGGRDRLLGRAGDDSIRAGDGQRDSIDCGPGKDRVRSEDGRDRKRRCEPPRRRRGCAFPPDFPEELLEELEIDCRRAVRPS